MADVKVSEDLAKKFATEKDTPTCAGCAPGGARHHQRHYVPNLRTVELKPWARRGGSGVFINHEALAHLQRLLRLRNPAGGKLAPQRQLFEEMILVLDGRGSTTVWNDAGAAHHLRVEGGRDVRHSAQLLAPAFQRLGPGAGALRRGHQRPAGHEPL